MFGSLRETGFEGRPQKADRKGAIKGNQISQSLKGREIKKNRESKKAGFGPAAS